ncbi:hypothetical protein HN51_023791 [Arachis hypogaea]|uniref:uncharacterized protein n=1 Tax=Arachis hypogaea TaxID=3818 RepID=UPI000DED1E44|nr:uncharacterized protein LOC112701974 [Arachis hypogaea]
MANSKDYISFVLLCVFLLSSHALEHELSKEERISTLRAMKVHGLEGSTSDSIHNGFGYYYYPNQWGSIPHPPPGSRYSPKRPPPRRGGPPPLPPPSNYYPRMMGFLLPFHTPLLPMHTPLMSFSGDSFGYQPLNIKDIEPEESYDEGRSVMRHRKLTRPSEIKWRFFHAFPLKTSSTMHAYIDGGKMGHGDTANKETMN